MSLRRFMRLAAAGVALLASVAGSSAQRGGIFQGSMEDPSIAYTKAPVSNAVADLNARLAAGTVRLRHEGRSGYLQSVLDALDVPVDSQLLLFSKTSLQSARIDAANPRALFFNERVAVGWVRDGDLLEVAAHDATLGTVFYTLEQKPPAAGGEPPQLRRAFICLGCHVTSDTLGVPGLLNFSTTESGPGSLMRAVAMDQTTPLTSRWGGWLVTGTIGDAAHLGNAIPAVDSARRRGLRSVDGLFHADGYRAATSDVAALLVFSHQTRMMNLLTRIGWEARAADPAHPGAPTSQDGDARLAQIMDGIAAEVVDYLLFIDEVALPRGVRASSGFVARFAARGPRDANGRSLHELDLTRRLLKYPCSYLIYSPAFDALPAAAKEPLYRRLWDVLSGSERGERYRRALSREDRQAIVEILRDTKPDLPEYFRGRVR